jgi:nucleoid DNA-binding protein
MTKNRHNSSVEINIDSLSMEELAELNKRIINRLKELNSQKQVQAASQFRIGDIVSFLKTDNNTKIIGFIISIRKTRIKIITETSDTWTVSPALLRPENKPSKKLLQLLDSFIPKTLQ